jgi:hypothetical protein
MLSTKRCVSTINSAPKLDTHIADAKGPRASVRRSPFEVREREVDR